MTAMKREDSEEINNDQYGTYKTGIKDGQFFVNTLQSSAGRFMFYGTTYQDFTFDVKLQCVDLSIKKQILQLFLFLLFYFYSATS